MIYELSHRTSYEYAGAVSLSHHVVRLRPRDTLRQQCLEYALEVSPHPGVMNTYMDYFGNPTAFFSVEGSHKDLEIVSRCRVEVTDPVLPKADETPVWELVQENFSADSTSDYDEACEFIQASPQIKRQPEFAEYARPSFMKNVPLMVAVTSLTARIFKEFKFDPKATTIATPLDQVLKQRRGVCQDFAQLEIACLRAMGIPARYVSGYLETDPPKGRPRLVGADASHAWVSFYCPGAGWIDVDPTNNIFPTHRHVTIAWGRDYHDVSPVRGVILGSGDHSLKVAVDMVPMPVKMETSSRPNENNIQSQSQSQSQ